MGSSISHDELHEQSESLSEDARLISEQIQSNKDVSRAISKLIYRYEILRLRLVDLKENENGEKHRSNNA